MTARIRNTETEGYMQLGASAVVAKPFDPATLPSDIEQIWRGIQKKWEARPDATTPAAAAHD
jgi:DNA-binding response OmpR family regulator